MRQTKEAGGRRSENSGNNRSWRLVATATASVLLVQAGLASASSTWIGPSGTTGSPTTGNWNTTGNWSPSGIPTSAATTELDFIGTGGYTSTDDIAGAFNLNILNLSSTGTSTIAAGTGDSLNFVTNGVTAPTIVQNTGAGTFSVSAPIAIGANTTINQANGAEIDFSGAVTGSSNSISINNTSGSGNSTVKFTGTNTFNGLTLGAHVTGVAGLSTHTNTLGSGTVNLSGGSLKLQGQQTAGAAVQQTISVTGYNQNIIVPSGTAANGVVTATTTSVDGNQVLYQKGFVNGTSPYGLNTTGLYTSEYNSAINFQLGYTSSTISGNTVLQLASNGTFHPGDTNTGTFTLTAGSQKAYQSINLLDTSSGVTAGPVSVTFNFSDSSSETQTYTNQDWYYGGSQARLAVGGNANNSTRLGSVRRTTTANNDNYPVGIYEEDFTLSPVDQSKTLVSVGFSVPVGAFSNNQSSLDLFALSGAGFNAGATTNATQTYANNVNVTADSNIDVSGSLTAVMGNLSIGSNKLSVTSSDSSNGAYSLTLGSVSLSGNPTFNVANNGAGTGTLKLGAVNDGGTARTITINPTGTGTVTLTAAGTYSAGPTVNVNGGTLNSNNATALGTTAQVTTSSGATFALGATQQISSLNGAGGTVSLGANALTIGNTDSLSGAYAGIISGTGAVTVSCGTGTVTLGGPSTYSGSVSTFNSNNLQIPASTIITNGVVVANASTTVSGATITSGPLGTASIVMTFGQNTQPTSNLYLGSTPGLVLANPIYLGSSGPSIPTIGSLNTSGTNTYSGNIQMGTGSTGDTGHNMIVTEPNGGELDFTGNILANPTADEVHAAITFSNSSSTGNATIRVTGNNTFDGGSTVNPHVTLAVGPSTYATGMGVGSVTLAGGTVALRGITPAGSQQVIPITNASFNADTIVDMAAANGQHSSTGTPTSTVDGASLFYENGYQGVSTPGVPTGGLISSATTGNHFQIANDPTTHLLTVNNTLRFTGSSNSAQVLTLANPGSFSTLDFLTTSQSTANWTITLDFSSGAPDSIGGFTTSDWYGGTTGHNAIGLNPAQYNTSAVFDYGSALKLQEFDLFVPLADQSRIITGISVVGNITGGGASADFYAVSGASVASSIPQATQAYANNIAVTANSGIDVSGSLTATIGTLTIGNQTLSITSADATTSAYSLTTGTVSFLSTGATFNVANSAGGGAGSLILGAINDNGAAQQLMKTGAGTLVLSQAAISISEPSVYSVVAGTLASNNATALNATTGSGFHAAGVSVASGATFSVGASQQIDNLNDYDAVPVVNGASVLLNGNTLSVGSAHDRDSSFSGVISNGVGGAGSLEKIGGGTMTLAGSSTYSGGTMVAFGALVAANMTGSATGTGSVSLSAGGASLGGTGIISGVVSVTANAKIFAGIPQSHAVLNNYAGKVASTLTIGTGSSLQGTTLLDLTAAPNAAPALESADKITVGSGSLTLGGTLTVTNPNSISFAIGQSYDLFDFGSETGTFGTMNLPTLSMGETWVTTALYTSGIISIGGSGPANLFFTGFDGSANNANWNTGSPTNFTTGSDVVAFHAADNVTFDNTHNMSGNYTVAVASGGVVPASMTVTGNTPYTFSGGNIGSGSSTSLTVASGATMVFDRGAGARVALELATLNNSGTVNLENNRMVIHNTSQANADATTAAVFTQLQNGFAGGTWAGGTSPQILSSDAAGSSLYTLGEVESGTDVLVRYAYYGDANLDGSVDGTDYSMIDTGFGSAGAMTGWQNGDFNYDGHVDGSDYSLIDNAFNTQTGTAPAVQIATNTSEIAGGSAAVPEPASLGLLGIGALGLMSRRRRRM